MTTTVRWAVLGTGRIAAKVGPVLARAANSTVTAVGSRSLESGRRFAETVAPAAFVGSYDEAIRRPDVNAVYIALPPSMHEEWTVRSAELGKGVLCEKPLASTLEAAESMRTACCQRNVPLLDGMMWLHHPRAQLMRNRLDAGTTGPLRRVTAAFTFFGDGLPADDHRFSAELGGGSLLDQGWYCVGAILWAYRELPTSVFGQANHVNGADRSFVGSLMFPGHRTGMFDCGYETSARRWIEAAGPAGSLICDDFTRPWTPEKARFWIHDRWGKSEEVVAPPSKSQEELMVDAFCDQVRRGGYRADWADRSVDTQRVLAALAKSASTGKVIPVESANMP